MYLNKAYRGWAYLGGGGGRGGRDPLQTGKRSYPRAQWYGTCMVRKLSFFALHFVVSKLHVTQAVTLQKLTESLISILGVVSVQSAVLATKRAF